MSKPISDLQLFGVVGLLLVPEVLLLILWSAIDPPSIEHAYDPNLNLYHDICSYYPIPFIIIDLAYKSLILLMGVFLAVSTRGYDSLYNEASIIGISIYTIALLLITAIAIIIAKIPKLFLLLNQLTPFFP